METKSYEFDDFRIDLAECALLQHGSPVPLTPKAFDTLRLLVENSGRLLDKESMMERLWPDAHVEEANLANNISLLRKALGASGSRIQTVPRRGYRFTGEVRAIGNGEAVVVAEPAKRNGMPFAISALLTIAGIAIGFVVARMMLSKREPPTFRQATFRRGIIYGARYANDGVTIVYSAAHEGKPAELFVTRADQRESKALGVRAEALLAVSKRGELAILTKAQWMAWVPRGTLARMPITGGAPREMLDDVQEADFSPDGEALAVIRWNAAPEIRVEYPIGHVIYRAARPTWPSHLRVSPDGNEVAFILHEAERFDDRGRVVIVDKNGKELARSRVFTSANGLAWHGDEVWLGAAPSDLNNSLFAIDHRGRDRALAGTAGRLVLMDIASSGTALALLEDNRIGIIVRGPGEAGERELSWLDGSWLRDISSDGRKILFDEEGTAGGETAHVYLRAIDGAPAVNLGEGHAVALSPDQRWVLARQRFTNPPRLVAIPTGAGQPHVLKTGVEPTERAAWLPDNHRLVFVGSEPNRQRRTFVYDIANDAMRAITAEGVTGTAVTADGKFVAARGQLHAIDGASPPAPIPGVAKEFVARFTSDGRSVFTLNEQMIDRIDLASGVRTHVWTYGAARPVDAIFTGPAMVSANGEAYAYTYASQTSTLFVVEGLR